MTDPVLSDMERFLAICKDFGLDPEILVHFDGSGQQEVVFYKGKPRTTGYPGFMSTWLFDREGRFIETGAWEG